MTAPNVDQLFPKSSPNYLGREGALYIPDPSLVDAARAAYVLQWPLLINGEPGTGKSDFAFALAHHWAALQEKTERPLHECYVRSDSQGRDLLYSYDAIRRFGDAHRNDRAADEVRGYIELNGLGAGLALGGHEVVLIDEIDKAPRDVPNDLLRELDQGAFTIVEIPGGSLPEYKWRDRVPLVREMKPLGARRPFVVVTSNEEKALPEAFLRRCAYHFIRFPSEDLLEKILLSHLEKLRRLGGGDSGAVADDRGETALVRGAVHHLSVLRADGSLLRKKPSTSELIGWVLTLVQAGTPADRAKVESRETRAGDLPFLGCLIKRRDDLERLGARVGLRHAGTAA